MGLTVPVDSDPVASEIHGHPKRTDSQTTEASQTASDYIERQLQLEAEAREALPYSFNTCTQPLGPLRQSVFACLTCSPPPASAAQVYTPAGVCYACSISCHSEHTLVELFCRRNFVCDCGTMRLPSTSLCTLRADPVTGANGVHSQAASTGNQYNHNFQNRFCGCGEEYDAEQEKGTMFQCLGLGTVETGGCGEDWWHPPCLMGFPKDWKREREPGVAQVQQEHLQPNGADEEQPDEEQPDEEQPDEEQPDEGDDAETPPGFPHENDFEHMVCYKCVESNPWIKQYAGTAGFLPAVFKRSAAPSPPGGTREGDRAPTVAITDESSNFKKRKAFDDDTDSPTLSPSKRVKDEEPSETATTVASNAATPIQPPPPPQHFSLPPAPSGTLSLFLKDDFRDHLCHCPSCFPHLLPHPQLLEEEETYEPPLSSEGAGSEPGGAPGSGGRSHGTGSLLERGEAALSGVDRVRAIEGVMVYNNLKEKVKAFLKPYAESGRPVGAEDIKAYFEKLRGDDQAILEASTGAGRKEGDGSGGDGAGGSRREQRGY